MRTSTGLRRRLAAALAACLCASAAQAARGKGTSNSGAVAQTQGQPQVGGGSSAPQTPDGAGAGVPNGGSPNIHSGGQDRTSGPDEKMGLVPPDAPSSADASVSQPSPIDDPAPVLSIADAAEDFKTIVESYVAKNSVDGVWLYPEKKTTARLTLVAVDPSSVRTAGKGLYAGDAVLLDTRTKKKRRLQFKVDLSGTDWRVVSVRPAAPAAR